MNCGEVLDGPAVAKTAKTLVETAQEAPKIQEISSSDKRVREAEKKKA